MAPRKGKGRQAVRNNKGGFPMWAAVLIGVLIGAVLVVMAMRGNLLTSLHKADGPQANPQATAKRASEPGVLETGSDEAPRKKPQYDFYSVLSEREVRIPDAEISAQARVEQQAQQQAAPAPATPAPTPAAPPANAPAVASENVTAVHVPPPAAGSGYLLQVGAFPNAADAETLKAKLALQGFVANVQQVAIGGQTYNRVRLGPFRSATELESTKQRLSAAGINAIALKEGR